MPSTLARRQWLKRSALAAAGLSLGSQLFSRGFCAAESAADADFLKQNGFNPFNESASEVIRIGSNENPYGPSPLAQAAMNTAVAQSNRYPWENTKVLRKTIGEIYGLSENHVLMGAGSSELLGVVSAFAGQKKGNLVAAYPTFKLWFTAAQHFGLSVKSVPLTAAKLHDLPAMLSAIDAQTRLVYVVNPHNPTGTVADSDALEKFVVEASKKAIVLLDEAYTEYANTPSMAHLTADNTNVVVAKTFSKIHGLAGARIGYALAHPTTINQLAEWQPWRDAGAGGVALAGAQASLADLAFQLSCRQRNDAVKAFTTTALTQLGMQVIPSGTSFIYYDTKGLLPNIEAITAAAGIVGVRTFEQGTTWRRTSLGTITEMQKFVTVLKKG
jgi:histidinol-phosphate aminotransferase